MTYFRPKQGHADVALTEQQLGTVRDVIRVVAKTLDRNVATASRAEKSGDAMGRAKVLPLCATLSDALYGLIRIRDRGGSVRQFVGEFSPLAMEIMGMVDGLAIILKLPIETCKSDPKMYAYAELDRRVNLSKGDIAAENKMLLAAADKARAKRSERIKKWNGR